METISAAIFSFLPIFFHASPYAPLSSKADNQEKMLMSYNEAGNRLEKTGASGYKLQWGLSGKPEMIQTERGMVKLAFGNGNRRYLRVNSDGEKIFYVGDLEYVQKDSATMHQRIYISAGEYSPAIEVSNADGEWESRYFLKDHLGSRLLSVDDHGVATNGVRYEAWGQTVEASGVKKIVEDADSSFTGHKSIEPENLIDMNARVYDKGDAHFLSPDAFLNPPGLVVGLNRYSYVANSPLNYTDPSGWTVSPNVRALSNFQIYESAAREIRYSLPVMDTMSRQYLANQGGYSGVLYRADRRQPHTVLERGFLPNGFRGIDMTQRRAVMRRLRTIQRGFNLFRASEGAGNVAGMTGVLSTSYNFSGIHDLADNFGGMITHASRHGYVYEIDPGEAGLVSFGLVRDRVENLPAGRLSRVHAAAGGEFALDPEEVGIFGPVLGEEVRAVHVFMSTNAQNELLGMFRDEFPHLTHEQITDFSRFMQRTPIRIDANQIRSGAFSNHQSIIDHVQGMYANHGFERLGLR